MALTGPPVPLWLVAMLLAGSVAWGRRWGLVSAALALGLWSATLAVAARTPSRAWLHDERPLAAAGVVVSHPLASDGELRFTMRAETLRRGARAVPAALDLRITMPAVAAAPAIGTRVRVRGYPRRSAGFANGVAEGSRPWRMRLKSARFLTVEGPPGAPMALAGRLRERAEELLDDAPGESGGEALARALLLGDRSRLPKVWWQALRRAGLAHLLAVSGLHVGLSTVLVLLLVSVLPRRLGLLLAAVAVAGYLLLIGPRPSMLRASVMGLLALAALLLERPPRALNALACGAAALVLADPRILLDLGFQLSASATAGILVLTPRYAERWTALPMPLRRPLAVTVAAQLATLPFLLPLTGGLHPLAPLLNLVAIPWLALCLLAAWGWLAAAAVSSAAGALARPLLDLLAAPLDLLAALPAGGALQLPLAVSTPVAAAAAAVILVLAAQPRLGVRCALVLILLLAVGARPPAGRETPELLLLDVGQGDAILLRDGERAVLVDGGGWPSGDLGGRVLVPALVAAGVRRLDAVVLTHPDADHCAGLVDVARYLAVAEVALGPGWRESACAAELVALPAVRWRVLWRGESWRVGRWRLTVLAPPPGQRRGNNDRSLVLRAEVHGRRVLLTGDIEAAAERRLLSRGGGELAAEVLKVAHHGSKTSTSAAFLAAVSPRLALISAGPRNAYGHPHPTVVERLRQRAVRVLRSDRSGAVRLRFPAGGPIQVALPGAPRAARAVD